MSRAAIKANPFAQLLGMQPVRLPKATSAYVVVDGKRVTDVRDIARILGRPSSDPLVAKLRRELERARARARYQRQRQDPQQMAKRREWYERNRDQVREYRRAYDERNRERVNKQQADWARANYRADPQKQREKQRAYYQRNREAILQRLRDKKALAKAARSEAAE
ncbi:MAG: hypothetical protein KF683_04965 [Rubrivivax sp.]|nr:hypothetical protein [Rubrivivax sp.]